MIILKKIKAAALQFAILVSVIIALLLGSFLILTYTHQFFNTQSQFLLNSIEGTHKGIAYGLDPKNTIIDSLTLTEENTKITLHKKFWGGYLLLQSKAAVKSKSFQKMGLIGAATTNPKTALQVTDEQLPLVVVGDTKIEGTAIITSKGIKPGVISGHYYNGKQLVYGQIKTSTHKLPELDKQWLQQTKQWMDFVPSSVDVVIEAREQNTNSFLEPTQIMYNPGKISVNQEFIGNICIKSDTEIVVSRFAKLTDVLLIAPTIIIEKGFRGNAQLLASKNINVEEDVILNYPSSLVLIDTTDVAEPVTKGEEPIYLSENSMVKGTIVYLPEKEPKKHANTSVTLQPKSVLEGSVYCNGNLELLATVKGTVYTQRFIANQFGSRYINHIYNGKILGNDIPEEYCGLPFSTSNKGVVKWLY